MTEILTSVLVVAGGLFAFVAALGVLRLPDVLIRMHASTKAGTRNKVTIKGVKTTTANIHHGLETSRDAR